MALGESNVPFERDVTVERVTSPKFKVCDKCGAHTIDPRCEICGFPTDHAYRPASEKTDFRDSPLGRWFAGEFGFLQMLRDAFRGRGES